MSPPPTEPQYRNKTSQEDNGTSTILTEVLGCEVLTVSITVVDDPVEVAPATNPPAVALFPLLIDVPSPPILPSSPPHLPPSLPPPLPTEHIPLIFTSPPPSDLFADK